MAIRHRSVALTVNYTPQRHKVVGNYIAVQQTQDAPDLMMIVGDGAPTIVTPGTTLYSDGGDIGWVDIWLPETVPIPDGEDGIRVNIGWGLGDVRQPNWAADVRVEAGRDADGNVVPLPIKNEEFGGLSLPLLISNWDALNGQSDASALLVDLIRARTALDSLYVRLGGGRDGQSEADALYARLGGGRDGQSEADALYARLGGGRDGQSEADSIYARLGGGRDGQAAGSGVITEIDGV